MKRSRHAYVNVKGLISTSADYSDPHRPVPIFEPIEIGEVTQDIKGVFEVGPSGSGTDIFIAHKFNEIKAVYIVNLCDTLGVFVNYETLDDPPIPLTYRLNPGNIVVIPMMGIDTLYLEADSIDTAAEVGLALLAI